MTSEEEQKLAENFGFSCEVDNRRGPYWYKFFKGTIRVWKIKDGWMRARLIEDTYSGHQQYESLAAAFIGD